VGRLTLLVGWLLAVGDAIAGERERGVLGPEDDCAPTVPGPEAEVAED
jgi:hypothetical protein